MRFAPSMTLRDRPRSIFSRLPRRKLTRISQLEWARSVSVEQPALYSLIAFYRHNNKDTYGELNHAL